MHSISKDLRRATRDMDLDFIKYSLEDNSIIRFIDELSNVDDGIKIKIDGEIKELHHQDYDGKRVNIELFDKYGNKLKTKLDIGVHKLLDIKQDDYYFNLDAIEDRVSLLINSPEQIFTEKLKSLLKLGFRSTRYKDLFDFYYLINNDKLDRKKLLKVFQVIIFDDNNMFEETVADIYSRLESIFNSNIYKRNLSDTKNNWLDIPVNVVIESGLKYIEELSSEVVGV